MLMGRWYGGTLENNLIIADSVWIDSSNVADYE